MAVEEAVGTYMMSNEHAQLSVTSVYHSGGRREATTQALHLFSLEKLSI